MDLRKANKCTRQINCMLFLYLETLKVREGNEIKICQNKWQHNVFTCIPNARPKIISLPFTALTNMSKCIGLTFYHDTVLGYVTAEALRKACSVRSRRLPQTQTTCECEINVKMSHHKLWSTNGEAPWPQCCAICRGDEKTSPMPYLWRTCREMFHGSFCSL